MALPTNAFQNVATYQKSALAALQNQYAVLSMANKKFKNFQNIQANLGDTVTFTLPTRYTAVDGLAVPTFQGTEQRVQTLTVDNAKNVSYAFSDEQRLFNLEAKGFMEEFGDSAVNEIGAIMEADVSQNFVRNTYRFYGDGTTAIDSSGQLARALSFFRNYGSAKGNCKGYLPDIDVPPIIDSNATQFTLNRGNKETYSWEVADFARCNWYEGNLLPTHTAGTAGNNADTLTVASFVTDADGGISSITFTGVTVDAGAIKQYDLLQFQDSVSGQPDIRYRTFIGHQPSANPVQIAATADADATAGSVTVAINPKLYSAAGSNQNLTVALAVGMEAIALPSHRVGCIVGGDALFLGMPNLPKQPPYDSWNENDKESGAAMRMTYGTLLTENTTGFIHSTIWGSTMPAEYAMRLVFPLV